MQDGRRHQVPKPIQLLFGLFGAAALMWSQSGPIVVWKVGSPYGTDAPDTATPPELAREAESIGTSLRIIGLPAKGFAERLFQATETGDEPDILVIDNYGLIEGITTDLGSFTGIDSSQPVKKSLISVTKTLEAFQGVGGGWEFLIASSRNHTAARALALRTLECPAAMDSARAVNPELQQLAIRVGTAYLEGETAAIAGYSDEDRIPSTSWYQYPVQTHRWRSCGSWGNDRLAMAAVQGSVESQKSLGTAQLLLVFRKAEDQWKLLAVSNEQFRVTSYLVLEFADVSARLKTDAGPAPSPTPATLLTPDGQYPQPEVGERFGSFRWRPSRSQNVVAEVAEFTFLHNTRMFIHLHSEQNLDRDSHWAGRMYGWGGPWKWRVWSITDQGVVALTSARSFIH